MPHVSNSTQIGIQWQAGTNSGGTPVIDYTVSFDGGNGIF
jgi:hypothetical protein